MLCLDADSSTPAPCVQALAAALPAHLVFRCNGCQLLQHLPDCCGLQLLHDGQRPNLLVVSKAGALCQGHQSLLQQLHLLLLGDLRSNACGA